MSDSLTEMYATLVAEGRLTADPAQEAVLPELDRVRRAIEEAGPTKGGFMGLFSKPPEPVKGLYIWGGVGRGKSMLMDFFHATVDTKRKRRVHFHRFMQEVQAGLHQARKTGVDDAILPVAKEISESLRLLSFDEMQITDIADAMIVGRLFERLFADGVVVVTTSNRVPKDLYKDGLNRQLFLPFIDLLSKNLTVHELASPVDYRQNRLEGAQVYFHPADGSAREAVSAIWTTLTGGRRHRALVLTVKGRDVEIPYYRNGVGRASFWDLCARPLGPADYLAVADALRVLILEDVPILSSENYNEAKRFVTLIDALYEARVRVIMSAADAPERLYLEGEGSFEFERTASRLREMQAADWATD
ncbi:MAG: cell division protein ZapE [Pseudomonadota bacterium]